MKIRIDKILFRLAVVVVYFHFTIIPTVNAETPSKQSKVPRIDFWITSQTYDPVRYEIGLMIAKQWQKLGFDVDLTAMEWTTMSSKGMSAHEHGAFIIQWSGRIERVDPFHWLHTLHHSSESRSGGYNISGYNNSRYDAISDKFARSLDLKSRKQYAFEAQKILAHDVPQPPLVHRVVTQAYNSRDFENAIFSMGEGLNSFWNWLNITPISKRKSIRVGSVTDIKLLNPLSTKTGSDINVLRMIYDTLVRTNLEGKPIPWAADSFEYLNETTIKVILKKGMSFHDGKPVRVEDVKYTFDLIKKTRSPYYISKTKGLKEVIIQDNQTLLFKLKEPFAPFLSNSLGTVCILPEHIWKKRFKSLGTDGILKWANDQPVGSGPFTFKYWRSGEELKLARNNTHFHPPKIEEYIRIPYAKAHGIVQGLQAREIDASSWSLLPLEEQILSLFPHLTVKTVDDLGYYMLHYNLRKKPYNDIHIRRALTYAIPKKKIVELIFSNRALPAYSIVAAANAFWHNPDIEKVGDNISKSREILKKAGFRWDDTGKIHYPTGSYKSSAF